MNRRIALRQHASAPGAAYVELWDRPDEPAPGFIKRSVDVHQLIPGYYGPRICIDFNDKGVAIGIEIVYPHSYDE